MNWARGERVHPSCSQQHCYLHCLGSCPSPGWAGAEAAWIACKLWACGLLTREEEDIRAWSSSSSIWMVPAPFLPAVSWEQRLSLTLCVPLVFGNVMGLDSDADD